MNAAQQISRRFDKPMFTHCPIRSRAMTCRRLFPGVATGICRRGGGRVSAWRNSPVAVPTVAVLAGNVYTVREKEC